MSAIIKYNILVFISGRTDKGSIEWNINKWYGYNCIITYIGTDYLLAGLMNNSELQQIADNFRLNYYDSIYITTQKKRTRQAIRQLFKKNNMKLIYTLKHMLNWWKM